MAAFFALSFAFIAFDYVSQTIQSHGSSEAAALAAVPRTAADAPIYVIAAGRLGEQIWAQQLNLFAARELLEANGMSGVGFMLPRVQALTPKPSWWQLTRSFGRLRSPAA
jgi:hypothetical protein